MRLKHVVPVVIGTLAMVVSTSGAQSTNQGWVRVTVRDSTGQAISGAELTLLRGVREIVARGATNAQGKGVLAFDVRDSTDLDVAMRKIGYARTDHFFFGAPHDTSDVTITVAPIRTATLAAVKVTAEQSVLRKSYYLDADDIENAPETLDNGWEIVKRLRPDMLTSRGGCPTGVQEIWVNGKWIRLPLEPIGMAKSRERVGVPARARFGYAPVTVMSEIAPEHIQEITYHDCLDFSIAAVGTQNAMFVTLKPGVVYQRDVGSFVVDTPEKPGDTNKKK